MLQVIDYRKTSSQPPRVLLSTSIIRAVSIAHSNWSTDKRARLAADWITGKVLIDPTVKLAAEVFEVSRPLIVTNLEQRTAQPQSRALGLLAYGWQASSPQERARFCAFFEHTVWRALERVCDSTEHV
jgi:hypothetical protein